MIRIKINDQIFTADFKDVPAANELIEKMPFTIHMSDLSNKEKYYYLDCSLSSATAYCPSTIYEGEIMCWSRDTLVIFYKNFSNSYGGYVKLGRIKELDELTSLLKKNQSIEATFSLLEE